MFNNEQEVGTYNPDSAYLQKQLAIATAMRNPTITDRLKQQKSELEFRLGEINDVLTALESSPEIQKVVDAVSKIRGI